MEDDEIHRKRVQYLYLCLLTAQPTSAGLDNFEIQANDNYIGHNTFNWTSEVSIKKNSSRTRTSILLNDLEISHMALEGTYSWIIK